ncbi:uncharacterized protein LOC141914989 [Tubulanus polymorphus]|uniref:uncharacterized protein LOC141914989 n=1 Tax=Tubulanus polymorphus TaxID=672921 RepID=UPI003DA4D13B
MTTVNEHTTMIISGLDALSEEQLADYREAFHFFDKDGNGHISVEELGISMRALGKNPSEAEIKTMIEEVDVNGNGTIEFGEFISLMLNYGSKGDPELSMREAFKTFDKDGNGFISKQELVDIMTKLGEPLTKEEAENLMQKADLNGDGQLDYNEFIKVMLR